MLEADRADVLRVPLADIHGVVEFYTMFYNTPTARTLIRVCQDPACHLAGVEAVAAAIEERLGLAPDGETSADGFAYLRARALPGHV